MSPEVFFQQCMVLWLLKYSALWFSCDYWSTSFLHPVLSLPGNIRFIDCCGIEFCRFIVSAVQSISCILFSHYVLFCDYYNEEFLVFMWLLYDKFNAFSFFFFFIMCGFLSTDIPNFRFLVIDVQMRLMYPVLLFIVWSYDCINIQYYCMLSFM